MADIKDIKSTNWQIVLNGQGGIVQGVDDINQSLLNIYNTQKGTSPLNPDFGIDLLASIDQPINTRGAVLSAEMASQTELYEPRIVLTQISYKISGAQLIFALAWEFAEGFGGSGNKASKPKVVYLLANESGFVFADDSGTAIQLY